jgi:hypothetical protein
MVLYQLHCLFDNEYERMSMARELKGLGESNHGLFWGTILTFARRD